MAKGNRYDGVDPYAVNLIKSRARKLIGHAGFTPADLEDVEQDLMLDLHRRLPQFDPARASRNTFIARIVEHRVVALIDEQKAQSRDYRLNGGSLNDPAENNEDETTERLEMLDEEDYLRRTGAWTGPAEERHNLAFDLGRVLASLTPEQCNLCRRLMMDDVTEIAADQGVSRFRIHRDIRKLRAVFEQADLKKYL